VATEIKAWLLLQVGFGFPYESVIGVMGGL